MKCIALALCLLPLAVSSAPLISEGAKLEKLSGEFDFTEGPASDKQGNVFFTDQPNNRIMKWGIDGSLSTCMQPCGRANGLCFDRHGNLWAAADEENELWRISPKGEVQIVLDSFEGKKLNGPNDLWIDRKGGLYFTDPFYKRSYWTDRGDKEITECVYFLGRDRKKLIRVIDDLKKPNGIIGTPDGKLLYVADIKADATYKYRIQKDGSLADKQLYCTKGSDGMTIDNLGNIYLTGKGVFVFSPAGEQIEHIEVPEPWTANVCFGGKDRRTLFITASKSLYSIRLNVKGVDSQ